MLRNTTQTVSSLNSSGFAGLTGSWLTLGTGGEAWEGLSFRANIATAASNTDSLSLIFEFSDDQSVIAETLTRVVTGTQIGLSTASGQLVPGSGDVFVRTSFPRTYVRLRLTGVGITQNFGVVTVGVDGGDYRAAR
jgi:hypothetical protein